MNILLFLAFDGTAYHGFQVQKNARSVCATLQDGMAAALKERPDVKGCSRTDAGVHARQFALSFRSETGIPLEKLPLALNTHLPEDIRVLRAQAVPADFHARYSALGKEYRYYIWNSAVDDPFARRYHHRLPGPLDADAMHAAGQVLLGHHDFAGFSAAGGSAGDTHRNLTGLQVTRKGDLVSVSVAGDGFLYNMVRIIAGTLVLAGQKRLAPADVKAILQSRNRNHAGPTLPAKGLFLHRVFYRVEDVGE